MMANDHSVALTMNNEEIESNLNEDQQNDIVISESLVHRYFSHCNLLSKNIISEQKSLIKFVGDGWNDLDYSRKDSLLDLLLVEDNVRQLITNSNRNEDERIQESFPRLFINSGQKINVDYENDLWTWRDEHSGPFSWMSRSQQDLTLTDIETENVSKPQPKTLRVDLDNQDNVKEAEQQFTYPANCWSRDIIDDYRKVEKHITISPCTSMEFANSNAKNHVEETVETCEEIKEDTQKVEEDNITGIGRGESENDIEESSHKRKNSGKERRKRSPSPKKMLRSSSLRRSPSKASDGGEQQLISISSSDNYEEQNAFSNPLVETEWSSFVNDNGNDESSLNVHSAPPTQVMDRGQDSIGRSPYQVKKDNVHLITPSESPAQIGKNYAATNNLGSWSVESTPDHNTHLLKGMENDKSKKVLESSYQFSPQETSVLEKYEEDEVLTVESHGTDVTVSTKSENRDSVDIPTSGFDFLDNW